MFFPKKKEFYQVKMANWEGIECMRCNSPISAYKVSNIAITGRGTIDGDGFSWRPLKQFKVPQNSLINAFKNHPMLLKEKSV